MTYYFRKIQLETRLLFVVFVFILLGCESQTKVIVEPDKPASIPQNSIFVGGLDGGVFVLLEKYSSNTYASEIYYISGDLAYKGKMRLYPDSAQKFNINDEKSYQGWDGDVLYLVGDRQLRIED